MKPTVFIDTNDKQLLAAIVGRHSLKRNLAGPDALNTSREDFPFFDEFEGGKMDRTAPLDAVIGDVRKAA
jgi:hypothetical protein